MQRFLSTFITHLFVLVMTVTLSAAQEFQPYPGSSLDDNASQQASAVENGMEVQVYTTTDDFEKVYSFYKSIYKEVAAPFAKQTLPNGKEVQWAFFVLDGARDLVHSNYWMKVQRPYVGTVGDQADFQDVRETSVIQTARPRGPAHKTSHLLDIRHREHRIPREPHLSAGTKDSHSRRFS